MPRPSGSIARSLESTQTFFVLLITATWIAIATVYGRYHYVVAAAGLLMASFALVCGSLAGRMCLVAVCPRYITADTERQCGS
jgi:hypothetical protein